MLKDEPITLERYEAVSEISEIAGVLDDAYERACSGELVCIPEKTLAKLAVYARRVQVHIMNTEREFDKLEEE